jgi:hypothetical protein
VTLFSQTRLVHIRLDNFKGLAVEVMIDEKCRHINDRCEQLSRASGWPFRTYGRFNARVGLGADGCDGWDEADRDLDEVRLGDF